MADIKDLIYAASQKYGIDPNLLMSVAQQESGLNQSAVSPAGAIGVMQLMPETARELGVDPYDVAQNIEGGAKYLRQLLDRFNSTRLALAAYNAGPGAVEQAGGIPNYPETQNYVANVIAGAYGSNRAYPTLSLLASRGASRNSMYGDWDNLLSNAVQLISKYKTPALWKQVPAGTLTEEARHNRAVEDLTAQQITASLAASSAADAFKTAGERNWRDTAAMVQQLNTIYDEKVKQDENAAEQPFITAVEVIRKYLSDPGHQTYAALYGIDNYNVLTPFIQTHTGFKSVEELRDYVAQRAQADGGRPVDDPLWRMLNAVVYQHTGEPVTTAAGEQAGSGWKTDLLRRLSEFAG